LTHVIACRLSTAYNPLSPRLLVLARERLSWASAMAYELHPSWNGRMPVDNSGPASLGIPHAPLDAVLMDAHQCILVPTLIHYGSDFGDLSAEMELQSEGRREASPV